MLRCTLQTAPQLSNENLLINELIREYLVYNNYRASASVFLPGGARGGGVCPGVPAGPHNTYLRVHLYLIGVVQYALLQD